MTMPNPDAIEALARAIDPDHWTRRDRDMTRRDYYEAELMAAWDGLPFEDWANRNIGPSIERATAALTAAEPFIRAEALEDAWQPIEELDTDAYVLGFYERDDGALGRSYFIGRRYDIRKDALFNEFTGRWRVVDAFCHLPAPPAIRALPAKGDGAGERGEG